MTHGHATGVSARGAAAGGHAVLVRQVIDAAYAAFGNGLHIALLLAGSILLAAGLVTALTLLGRPADSGGGGGGEGAGSPRSATSGTLKPSGRAAH